MTMMTLHSSGGGLRSSSSLGSLPKLHASSSSPTLTDLAKASLTDLAKAGSNHERKSRRRKGTMPLGRSASSSKLGGLPTSSSPKSFHDSNSSMSFTDLGKAGSTHEKKSKRRGHSSTSNLAGLRTSASSGSLRSSTGSEKGLRNSNSSGTLSSKNRNGSLQRLYVQQQQLVTRTIVCDKDKADRETILRDVNEVSNDAKVRGLVVAGLLSTPDHHGLISSIDALVFSSRPKEGWMTIRYQDQCNDLDEYVAWVGQKIRMMKDYEQQGINERTSNLCGVVSWHARIVIPVGTKLEDAMRLFVDIKDDPSVLDMKLNGGLAQPGGLVKRFDWSDQGSSKSNVPLVDPFVIDLDCGWINPELRATSYRKFLNVALCRMKDAQRETIKKMKKQQSCRSKSPMKRGTSPSRRSRSPAARCSKSPARRTRSDGESLASRSKSPTITRASSEKWLPSGTGKITRASSEKRLPSGTGKVPTRVMQITDDDDESANKKRSKAIERMHQRSRNDNNDPHSPRSVHKGGSARGGRSTNTTTSSTSSKDETNSSPTGGGDYGKYWRSTVDPTTGDTYYYNKMTKETRWDKPVEMQE